MDGETELSDEFADLAQPDDVEVGVGKHVFKVRHFGVRDLPLAAAAVKIAYAAILDDAQAEAALAANVEQIVPIIASAIGLPAATVAKFRGDVKLQLFGAVLRVNQGFFVQCFAMKFGEGAKRAVEMGSGGGAGPAPSNA